MKNGKYLCSIDFVIFAVVYDFTVCTFFLLFECIIFNDIVLFKFALAKNISIKDFYLNAVDTEVNKRRGSRCIHKCVKNSLCSNAKNGMRSRLCVWVSFIFFFLWFAIYWNVCLCATCEPITNNFRSFIACTIFRVSAIAMLFFLSYLVRVLH